MYLTNCYTTFTYENVFDKNVVQHWYVYKCTWQKYYTTFTYKCNINVFDKNINTTFALWESSAVLSPENEGCRIKVANKKWSYFFILITYQIWGVLSCEDDIKKLRQIDDYVITWWCPRPWWGCASWPQ